MSSYERYGCVGTLLISFVSLVATCGFLWFVICMLTALLEELAAI